MGFANLFYRECYCDDEIKAVNKDIDGKIEQYLYFCKQYLSAYNNISENKEPDWQMFNFDARIPMMLSYSL